MLFTIARHFLDDLAANAPPPVRVCTLAEFIGVIIAYTA